MKILTSYVVPPVALPACFTAWVEGSEDWLQGIGSTVAEAIEDLEWQIEERN